MSLIHSAILEMEKTANPTLPGLAPSLVTSRPSPKSTLLPAVGGFAAVLVLSAAGWWLWQTNRPTPVAPLTTETTLQTAVPVPALPAVDVPAEVTLPSEAELPAEVDVIASAVAATPAQAATQIRPVARPKPRMPAPIKSVVVPQPAADDMPLEKRFALFLQAMKANDLVGAGQHLKALQAQMPAGTLSRLRAEAWFALRNGQDVLARQAYQNILEQSSGDEEASVNLASIEARSDRREVARQILNDALRSNPDSDALRHAVSRFKTPVVN